MLPYIAYRDPMGDGRCQARPLQVQNQSADLLIFGFRQRAEPCQPWLLLHYWDDHTGHLTARGKDCFRF